MKATSDSLLYYILSLYTMTGILIDSATLGRMDKSRLEIVEITSTSEFDPFDNLTFNFSCKGRSIGLYADQDYDCRIFHVCDEHGQGFPVMCANTTVFDQRDRLCVPREIADCEHAHDWYRFNELPYYNEGFQDTRT